MARLDIRVLGPVQVLVDGQVIAVGGPKPRAMLATLVVNRRRVVPSDALADAIWNDDPPDAYASSLQVFVSNLRKSLRAVGIDDVVRTVAPGYRLEISDDECDLGRFEKHRTQGARDADAGAAVLAGGHFRAALDEWSGAALADLRGLRFADDFAAAMDEERLLTVSSRIDSDIAAGRATGVVSELVALTTDNPLREPLWGQLITALYLSGRQADALEACRKVRTILGDELGIDPSPALVQLEQKVLRQEPLNPNAHRETDRFSKAMDSTVHELPNAVQRARIRLADGRTLPIPQDGLRIGRMTDNDLELDDPKVSRYHAQISSTRGGVAIRDLNSANGVYLNGEQIESAAVLSTGDKIRIGATTVVFEVE